MLRGRQFEGKMIPSSARLHCANGSPQIVVVGSGQDRL